MMLKEFVTGEISRVSFDTASRHLEVRWRNGVVLHSKLTHLAG
jgi:hypothetical protein